MTSVSVDRQGPRRYRLHRRARLGIAYLTLSLGLVLVLLPVLWLFATSVKPEHEFMTYPPTLFPKAWRWDNYVKAVSMVPFDRYFKNSVFLSTTFATLTVITSSLVGFGFARLRGPGKNTLFAVVVAMLMVPWTVLGIPEFMVFAKMGLVNSYWPWIIWGLTGSSWHIFLFRQFFSAFPKELEDAAEVDGCSRLRTYAQIFLPNSLPVIATSFIFNFQWVWGDWISPLLYLNDKLTTLSVVLAGTIYVDPKMNVIVTITMAAVLLYALPPVVVFLLAQRHILEGVVTTGIKG